MYRSNLWSSLTKSFTTLLNPARNAKRTHQRSTLECESKTRIGLIVTAVQDSFWHRAGSYESARFVLQSYRRQDSSQQSSSDSQASSTLLRGGFFQAEDCA